MNEEGDATMERVLEKVALEITNFEEEYEEGRMERSGGRWRKVEEGGGGGGGRWRKVEEAVEEGGGGGGDNGEGK